MKLSQRKSQIGIVIVNWNSGAQLLACINSIAEYSSNLVSETIIVDNASTDCSANDVENFPSFTIIRAGLNLGFGKACNLGARHLSPCEYLLFLNPDATLYSDTLPRALEFMQHVDNLNVGICGVQLVNESGEVSRHCSRFPSPISFVAHSVGLDRLIPSLGNVMAEWNHARTCKVEHVIGAFYLVRRTLFDSLHGFDERFFVYLEDLDFSYRARQAGWSSYYLASVQAFHAGGGTSRQVKSRRLFYSLRSRLLYSYKHFTCFGATAVLITTLLLEPIARSVQALLRCSVSRLKETWVAYGMLLRWLPQWVLNKETS